METSSFKKIDVIILLVILTVALIFRLYKITQPLADLHSWRQVDTAAVARNFNKFGFDLLHPRFDDLTSRETGIENPEGYRMVEFPIYNAIVGALYRYLPLTTIEIYGRLTTAISSLIIIAVIYFLGLKESNRLTAIIASATYAVFPFFVFFSRVVLPETTAMAFVMIAIYLLYKWQESKKNSWVYLVISMIFYAMSVLIKPTAVFYGITLLFIFIRKYNFAIFKQWRIYLYFMLSALPFILWRIYILRYPEGIPANAWLLTQVNTFEGIKTIFFRPAFFRWIFLERLGFALFGVYLSVVFFLGVIIKTKKFLLHTILLSAFVYLFTFQGGNVQHEYYQTILLPAIAIFIGLGTSFIILHTEKLFNPYMTYPVLLVLFGLSFSFSYFKVKDYYIYPNDLVQIAKIINTFTTEDDKIVTDRSGDTTLLYLANRRGAPSIYKSPEELANMGYSYLVTANEGQIKEMKDKKYKVVVENDQFALFKLQSDQM